jgi:long-chain acyl-CoA synthetase
MPQLDDTILHVFWKRVRNNPDRPAILHKVNGAYRPVLWREHGRIVELLAGGLLTLNVQPQERVAILSNTRPQWTWADIAILSVGAVTVPVYPTLNAPEVEYLLRHSGASGLFVENSRQLSKVLSISGLPAELRFIVVMDGVIQPDATPPAGIKILTWTDLTLAGEEFLPQHASAIEDRLQDVKLDDLATIVYTSGTTGVPKGAMILHRNIQFVCQTLSINVGFNAEDVTLSFLPLSHIFERIGGQMLAIYEGLIMAYAESMDQVPQNMMEVRPTIMNAVPRFYEKAYNRIIGEVRKMPKPQQHMVRWALALGKRAARQKESANGHHGVVEEVYRAELRIADRLVFSKIRRRFGGKVRFLVSGAAPLSTEVQQFFETIGMPIVEGYGLTETAAPLACNKPNNFRRGTVGEVLPGIDLKIAEDGEILVKGPSIFAGYYRDENATREAFKDGYFCTGDIGALDKDGYLRILDRKKDLIITAGGKHVAPQFLENIFVGERLISRVFVYGDRRKYISALITLNPEGLEIFAKANQIEHSCVDELIHHPGVEQEIARIVQEKNDRLATFEQIKRYSILDEDFSIENNELTPTLKMRRKVIVDRYKAKLDGLYDEADLQVAEGVERSVGG